MNLTGIISISGKPGLFKVVAQGKNNIIVESLEDKKRFPAYSTDRISALEDISVYTHDEDVALKTIFKSIYDKEAGKACISHKEDKKNLESYLLEILPNYDQDRVYISDVKKIFQWYNLLQKSGELKFEEEKAEPAEKAEKKEAKAPKAKAAKEGTDEEKAAKKETAKGSSEGKKVAAPKAKDKPVSKVNAKTSAPKKVTAVKSGTSRGK